MSLIIFVLSNRPIDLIGVKMSVPVRVQVAIGLVLRTADNTSVGHGRLKTVEIIKQQAHAFLVAYFVNILRELGKVLEDLLVFVDSNADLLGGVRSFWLVRGDEHRSSLLEALVGDHLTGLMDLAELSIVLNEVLHIVTLVMLVTTFRVLFLVLDRSNWHYVSIFFKIVALLLPDIIFKDLDFLCFLLHFHDLFLFAHLYAPHLFSNIIFLTLLIVTPGSVLRTGHLVDLVKFPRL